MRKIDKILCRAVMPPFLIALTVLTFVVFVNQIGDWSKLLISHNVSLDAVTIITAAILPAILIFSLPLSYLIGILIGISGLNGESQITALRACGVPVRRLLVFIIGLGVIVGIATGILSVIVFPQTNEILKNMKERIVLTQAPTEIQPRVFNDDLPGIVFYLEDITADRKYWSRIFLADNTDVKSPQIILSRSGTWITDAENRRLQLHLENGASYAIDPEDPRKDQITYFQSTDIPVVLNNSTADQDKENTKTAKITEQSTLSLWKRARNPDSDKKREVIVEINRRIALPFSVFPFALLGLTLSISAQKGGRTSGFALSLITVLLFYILFFNGIRLASVGKISPWLGPWSANILLAVLGIVLLIKTDWSFGPPMVSADLWKHRWEKFQTAFHLERFQPRVPRTDSRFLQAVRRFFRFLFPKVFDLYIARGFLAYFLWSLATCSVLFILLTLFELLDDIIQNAIPLVKVVEYFIFLIPQILMVAIPMSILLAVLINFGILEKNSEITAIKAGGWSLYRISIPVFLLAAGFCVSLFLIQDYILPYANERQDGLWNTIKGRPPQTTLMLQRKWILGESNRIYNYEYFDGNQDSFVGLNIYEIDLASARMLRRIRASRAYITPQGKWVLEKGWIRNFSSRQGSFRSIEKERFSFPESASYFKKEIFQPKESSKMTYTELTNYINYLMNSGYNAVELQVELYKKISFPLSCLTMALLAIPFSFIVGKKGAFFGIGASIAIAIGYLMISGLFETMGAYGILAPILAAWAPNIIFGAAGFWLLLSIRT